MPFVFAGYPGYLVEAGRKFDLPDRVVDRARRQPALSECAGLLSQVLEAHPASQREILCHAEERVLALLVAHEAAIAMYDEVLKSCQFQPAKLPMRFRNYAKPEPVTESGQSADEDISNQPSRRGRKGTNP